MKSNKWPKVLSPLPPEQQKISDDFMKYWHEVLVSKTRYNHIEKFNHGYVVKHSPTDFLTTLEIGAGLGEHLKYEKLNDAQQENYVSLELREQMAAQIALKFPKVKTLVADCQQPLPFADNHFDRILAIHVLEHLPNLPATIREMYRLCHKQKGIFSVVIPCEGSLAYRIARKISAQRLFERMYKQPYQWLIEREHINRPYEILEELAPYFTIEHTSFFPIPLPFIFCNLCIGMTLRPRPMSEVSSHHSPRKALSFSLPPLEANSPAPLWTGDGFRIGDTLTPVLHYSINNSGWNDDLTEFHEESAGDQHFIDQASREYALAQLKKHLHEPTATILEVGCSSGFMLEAMQQAFPQATIIGADVVDEPLNKLAEKMPHTPLLRFDLVHCPLPDNSVDAIVMLNVLEHIEDDEAAIGQALRVLKPGGTLIIEVPAGPHLYDAYDKILMHYRRYKLSALTQLLKKQGFQIKKRSHLGVLLYPGFWLVKMLNKKRLTESEATQKQKVDRAIRNTGRSLLLTWIMNTELWLGRFIQYPTGIRCLVTCTKPRGSA